MSGQHPGLPSGSRMREVELAGRDGSWYPLARVAPIVCLAVVFALVVSRTSNGLAWVAVLLACALAATAYVVGPQLVGVEVRSDRRGSRPR